jgi:hypothetical protein
MIKRTQHLDHRRWRASWEPIARPIKGYVSQHDPLYGFLWRVISDQLGVRQSSPAFRVFGFSGSNEVYGYEEKYSGARLICKFYGKRFGWDRDKAISLAHQEYSSLETLRGYGLAGSPDHVIRPLAVDRDINSVLALEYYDTSYFGRLTRSLQKRHRIGECDAAELLWLSDRWRERPRMWQDQEVWLHGDATPANFLFGHGIDAAAIDLERMRRGDRMFDLGRRRRAPALIHVGDR